MGCCCGRAALTAEENASGRDLSGKTFIVTGATAGIGLEAARVLLAHKARVVFLGRDAKKTHQMAVLLGADEKTSLLTPSSASSLIPMICDLGSFESIRKFVVEWKKLNLPLHCLINNAGVIMDSYSTTKEGWEIQFGTNHMGHFLLTTLLLDDLIKTKGRVVTVSSVAHKGAQLDLKHVRDIDPKNYKGQSAYQQSKLANIHFTKGLHKRYHAQGITAVVLHPGVIGTDLAKGFGACAACLWKYCVGACGKSVPQGAATTIFCALDESVEQSGGSYFKDSTLADAECTVEAKDEKTADALWQLSETAIATK